MCTGALYFFVCICICLCVFECVFALIVALQDFCFLAGSRAQPLCIELKMLLMPDLYPLPALPSTCLLYSCCSLNTNTNTTNITQIQMPLMPDHILCLNPRCKGSSAKINEFH